ncbi:MAG: hypothetical protein ISR48_01260 [Alphaproteobacteria bacterium]|nr:hypothetical protein [Alphaproteobacteria bacterium]
MTRLFLTAAFWAVFLCLPAKAAKAGEAVIYYCPPGNASCLNHPEEFHIEVGAGQLCTKVAPMAAAFHLSPDAKFMGFRCGGQNFGPPESGTIIIPAPDDKTTG